MYHVGGGGGSQLHTGSPLAKPGELAGLEYDIATADIRVKELVCKTQIGWVEANCEAA